MKVKTSIAIVFLYYSLLMSLFAEDLDLMAESWSSQVVVNTAETRVGAFSYKWDAGARSTVTINPVDEDWSEFELLQTWIFSEKNTGSKVVIAIYPNESVAPAGGAAYYLYTLYADWEGWKKFTLPLSDFVAVRVQEDDGWHSIDKVKIMNYYGGDPVAETVLYFDDFKLTNYNEELIVNPSFEEPLVSPIWHGNNWANLGAEFERVDARLNPEEPAHTGNFSQRMTVTRAAGGSADLQFSQPLALAPGDVVKLSFWLRGQNNSAPVKIQFRKLNSPYTSYFAAEASVTGDWEEYTLKLTLPDSVDPSVDFILLFSLYDETSLWIDDVSVSYIAPEEGGAPYDGNQVRNGSFEVGTDGWVATFREGKGVDSTNVAAENNIDADLESIIVADAPEGARVLRFEVFESCSAAVTTGYFPLRYGHPVTVGFWMRTSSAQMKLEANLGSGTFPNMIWDKHEMISGDSDWAYYSFSSIPTPNAYGTYVLELRTTTVGSYEIDMVSIVDDEGGPITQTLEAGFEDIEGGDTAHMYHLDDEAEFLLNVRNRADQTLTAEIVDLWGEIQAEEIVFEGSSATQGLEQIELVVPTSRLGGFKCSIYSDGASMPVAELLYTVLPRLALPGDVSDSFFGGHVSLSPYNLNIAKKVGYRWLRLFPPLATQWVVVEPTQGAWNFDTRGVARAQAEGFNIMAGFSSTPLWADAYDGYTTWYTNMAPANLLDWQEYVIRTQAAFAPYINTWEVWNEPDGKFLQVTAEQSKSEVYLDLLESASDALANENVDVELIAGAVVTLNRPFTQEILGEGGGDQAADSAAAFVDHFSFHYYDGYVGAMSPDETDIPAKIEYLKTFTNRNGEPLNLWVTEAGVKAPSWLESMRIPLQREATIAEYAHTLVRTAIYFKAVGVQKFFHYNGHAHQAGNISYRRETSIVDVDGIPQPSLAAHAAMVYFLEGAEPVGFEILPVGNAEVRRAQFIREGQPIEVLWSREPAQLGDVPDLELDEWDFFDMMGNSLTVTNTTELSLAPIYLKKNTLNLMTQQWFGSYYTGTTSDVNDADFSYRWAPGSSNSYIRVSQFERVNWSDFNTFSAWVYSEDDTGASIAIAVHPIETATGTIGTSYFLHRFDVTWTGWQEIVVPFDDFIAVRIGASYGWSNLGEIKIMNYYSTTPVDGTVLFFNDLKLTHTEVLP